MLAELPLNLQPDCESGNPTVAPIVKLAPVCIGGGMDLVEIFWGSWVRVLSFYWRYRLIPSLIANLATPREVSYAIRLGFLNRQVRFVIFSKGKQYRLASVPGWIMPQSIR